MDRDKFRIRFRKAGDLRLVSHHDLMRAFERMLRRADLPFRSTEGFHPHPRMVFALSLPLGVAGLNEVVELELTRELPPDEVLQRLAAQAPTGLELLSIRRIATNLTGRAIRAVYRIAVPSERHAALPDRCRELLAQPECRVERSHPQPKRVDIRPYLIDVCLRDGALELDLHVTPTGSARADEVLALLGLADLLDSGAVLERTLLELHDETETTSTSEPLASGVNALPLTAEVGEQLLTTDH